MKSYTNIEQSKKLIELGIDVNTADMMWDDWSLIDEGWKLSVGYYPEIEKDYGRKCYPAWSLAALLDVLPISIDDGRHCLALINSNPSGEIKWLCCYEDDNGNLLMECYGDNQVNACIEMILKLNEQKIL